MRRRISHLPTSPLTAALLATLISFTVTAEDAAPQPEPARVTVTAGQPASSPIDVAEVLRRLASDDWKKREAAERELVRLGDDALPAIDAMLGGGPGIGRPDAETRARLEGARRQIAEDRATGPTYVTLHLKDAPPADAVAAFAKASRGPISPYPDNLFEHGQWVRVTVDLDRVPYWDALRLLGDRLGVTPNGWNDGLRLMPGGGGGEGQFDGPSAVDGPFLIVANEVFHNRTVRLAAGAANGPAQARATEDDFGVQLSAFAEPKLTVLSCAQTVVIDEAVDDRGNSLVREAGAGEDDGVSYANRGSVWNLQAPLRYPAKNAGTKIARLRGHVLFTVQSAGEKVEVDDPLHATAAVRKVVKGVSIDVQPMRKADGGFELKFSLTPAAGGAADGPMQSIEQTLQRSLRIFDAKGNALITRSVGSAVAASGQTEYRMVYASDRNDEGDAVGEPAKLEWDIPTGVKQRKVAFDFKDLEMP